MDSFKAQTIEHYAKQLKTPSFNQYPDVIRQMDHEQSYEDFLIALMKQELDCRQESTRKRKIKAARFPYQKTLDEFQYDRPSISMKLLSGSLLPVTLLQIIRTLS